MFYSFFEFFIVNFAVDTHDSLSSIEYACLVRNRKRRSFFLEKILGMALML